MAGSPGRSACRRTKTQHLKPTTRSSCGCCLRDERTTTGSDHPPTQPTTNLCGLLVPEQGFHQPDAVLQLLQLVHSFVLAAAGAKQTADGLAGAVEGAAGV